MTKYLYIGILALAGCAQQQGWSVKVTGKVRFPDVGAAVYLQRLDILHSPQGVKHKLTIHDDGTFEEAVDVMEPGYFRIDFYGRQHVDFVLDRHDLVITVDGNKRTGAVEVRGSPDSDLLKRVNNLLHELERSPRVQELTTEIRDKDLTKERVHEIKEEYRDLMYEGYDRVADLLAKRGPSVAIVDLLIQGWLSYDEYPDLYRHVAEVLQEKWPDYIITTRYIDVFEQLEKVGVGQSAPEIAMPDRDGKVVRLSSFRGHYVLVDFWAKWCAPCRDENPNIVRMYNRYHDKGFEVFGVSLDNSRGEWLQAVAEDGLIWTQVSDLKSFDSPIVAAYQIKAIPSSVLVGPDGLIVAKGLTGKKLREYLQELFGS